MTFGKHTHYLSESEVLRKSLAHLLSLCPLPEMFFALGIGRPSGSQGWVIFRSMLVEDQEVVRVLNDELEVTVLLT